MCFARHSTSDPPRDAAAGMQGVARATAPHPDYKRSPCAPDCFAPQAFALMQAPAFLRRRLLVSLCFARHKPSSRRGILFRCVSMCSVVLHRDKAGQLSPKSGREHRITQSGTGTGGSCPNVVGVIDIVFWPIQGLESLRASARGPPAVFAPQASALVQAPAFSAWCACRRCVPQGRATSAALICSQ